MSLMENGSGLTGSDALSIMNSRGGSGYGGFGDWSFWIIILFLFALGGNGFGNGFGGGGGAVPTVQNDIQRGFDQQAVMGGINGLTAAVSNGFANAEISRCNGNTNILQALNNIGMSLQNCCCENRQQVADIKYAIANDGAATRSAIQGGIQTVLDKLCQQEIDALKEQNSNLRTQINLATLRESQTAQTSQILADNAAQTAALEHYLNPAPIPAYPVQNPNCCGQTFFSGCGGNG